MSDSPGGSARVMVVDDEPLNLKLIDRILRAEGYDNVELVQDPREVRDRYEREHPDLVLLDLNMPHLDGFAVLGQLRELNDALCPPVLVLTAQSGEDYLLRAFEAGAADFLSKPVNRRVMMARVQNLLAMQAGRRVMHHRNSLLEELVQHRTRELRHSRLDIVHRLGRAAELRDNETGQHIIRMSRSAALLARRLGWDAVHCELMLNASPLHDIGKIGVPDEILLKPGALTVDERAVMERHAVIGAEILAGSNDPLLTMAREIALTHHEWWDGSGYPNGLAGDAIPLSGRIVAIADVFDALLSDRPYKRAWPAENAIAYMKGQSGTQFDPALVEAFLDIHPQILQVRHRHRDADEPMPA